MQIKIEGASEHNLQDIDVEFGDGLTVVTGVSGSGKTSLVFDTLYHEARRRFLEIYTLGSTGLRLSPARVRSVTGLGPAVAVGQNLLNRNPGSNLASASGLHPLFRLLYARFGERYCPRCGMGLSVLSDDEIIDRLIAISYQQASITLYAPLLRGVRGSHATLLALLIVEFGAERILVDGQAWQTHPLDPAQPHDIEAEIGYITGGDSESQIHQETRQAIQIAASIGATAITLRGEGLEQTFARTSTCVSCGTWFGNLEPVHFHTPCPHCDGSGCNRCARTGLHPQAAAVTWNGLRFPELLAQPISKVYQLFADSERSSRIGRPSTAGLPSTARRLQVEIVRRLEALDRVGLGYISLDRPAPTLSRGEAQRVRLAVALTSRLEDMLHVLDEPTIGQHPADVARLLPAFRQLAGPVVFVEHDRIAAASADRAIDLGPGAGSQGGKLIFDGTPAELWQTDTPTGRYFSLRKRVLTPEPRPEPEKFLTVRGACLRNLRGIDVPIPMGHLTVITGVSGSGKSTFVEDVLYTSLVEGKPTGCRGIDGPPLKPVLVDQEPIGRNPRSNPATYTNLADIIRDCFAADTGLSPSHFSFNRPEGACPDCQGMGAVEVRMRYLPSTWIPCPACDGQRFSDEVLAARVLFGDRQLSIADFFELQVSDVIPLLLEEGRLPKSNRQAARRILEALRDVGLGYLSLGQPSPTLSGGEAQRVKLAKFLGKNTLEKHLLILDEPSTGLHPQDINGLLIVLDRLVRAGATILVVEHNTDIIRAADWVIDLGPGAGPHGGELLYAGPPAGLLSLDSSLTGKALREEALSQPRAVSAALVQSRSVIISIREARANNLQGVDVDFHKGALTVVTGVSGSGKSSLVGDVLEAEARRRFLESLSMYERQSTREGPEAPVGSVSGLGVAITVSPERRLYGRRATVGTATEISHHLAVLLSTLGERKCLECGTAMIRNDEWHCPNCHSTAHVAKPRHFNPTNYSAACKTCHGVGTMQVPKPEKLIIHPEKPLIAGAMYSPGFFPKGYLGKPFNHGYDMLQALAARYGFDPAATPWDQMRREAQHAFLFGDPQPLMITFHGRTGRVFTHEGTWPGFYGFIRDWDVGGTYTQTENCPECGGSGLRPEYTAVTLRGYGIYELSQMPLAGLARVLQSLISNLHYPATSPTVGAEENPRLLTYSPDLGEEKKLYETSLHTILKRLHFLEQVGLGYLHLNRQSSSLSAGEAQRIRLAGLLGSGLTSLTVLLDEPSRGLHPSEVEALLSALKELRDEGNTVIIVEHDLLVIRSADYLVDMGPGAGNAGGHIVAQGKPEQVAQADTITAAWLRGDRHFNLHSPRRQPHRWLEVRGARANNLRGEAIQLPLGVLLGVCGVSGSGKSTLVIDTLGRALAPIKQTTSVAHEPIDSGEHDAILGVPSRTLVVDQSRAGVVSPAAFLGLQGPLQGIFAASEEARALGLDDKSLGHTCSACGGRGAVRIEMGFLPDVFTPCDTCRGTGYAPEAWDVRVKGLSLPEVDALTIDQVYVLFRDEEALTRPLSAAREVGLGYLVLRQPGYTLSGGEAQRLKIARELCQKASQDTLYILDEPTVGQHLEDVARLTGVLHRLVEAGGSVFVVEHHPHLLAACDWLIELGPGGGPDGGRVIISGTPEVLANGDTPTAPYLREVLGGEG